MKKSLLILALAAGAIATSQAAVIYQNLTQAVGQTYGAFTFNKFNESLGTLTGVTFTIVTSSDSGSFIYTNKDASAASVDGATDTLQLTDSQQASGAGSAKYTGSLTDVTTTPTIPISVLGGDSQTFDLTSTSLIGSAVIKDLTAQLAKYESSNGAGTVSFNAKLNKAVSTSASISQLDSTLWVNSTELSLTYVYTAAPVPEPSQVAASMLLIGGIAGFVIVRRKKSASVA